MRILSHTNHPNITRNIYVCKNKSLSFTNNDEPIKSKKNPKEKEHKKVKTGSAAAIAALAVVCSAFMLSKGFQNGTNLFLNKTKVYFEKKLAHSTLNESGKKKKFYEFSVRRINSFIQKTQSINNITSLKDILFMKLMYKIQPTREIHKSISNYFEKISQKTVFDSYEKTKKYFEKMNKAFDELNDYILRTSADEKVMLDGKEYTKRELVEKAQGKRDMCNMIVNAFMDKNTMKNRYEYINEVTSSLYSSFWDASFKDFWTKKNKFKQKEMWQTFIAAEQIKGNKTKFASWAAFARNAVTYTKKDQIGNIHEYIKALDSVMPLKDREGIEIVKKLEWFVKHPDVFENNKELFFKELDKLKKHKFLQITDEKVLKTLEDCKITNIDLIERQINDNKPGIMQDMLSYYYKMSPFELEKSGALAALRKAVKSFDKSVEKEGVEFFDKLRDLRLGSAPTDVLTILFSTVMLSLGLGHAKDKDARNTIMLKSGIPVAGGIGVSMFSAAKLVSGGKSLALGFLSGIILNRVGAIADNVRKNRTENVKLYQA